MADETASRGDTDMTQAQQQAHKYMAEANAAIETIQAQMAEMMAKFQGNKDPKSWAYVADLGRFAEMLTRLAENK